MTTAVIVLVFTRLLAIMSMVPSRIASSSTSTSASILEIIVAGRNAITCHLKHAAFAPVNISTLTLLLLLLLVSLLLLLFLLYYRCNFVIIIIIRCSLFITSTSVTITPHSATTPASSMTMCIATVLLLLSSLFLLGVLRL